MLYSLNTALVVSLYAIVCYFQPSYPSGRNNPIAGRSAVKR